VELRIQIPEDEALFVKDDFTLLLAKRELMKRLIEIEMAEKLVYESKLSKGDIDDLSEKVKEGLYERLKSGQHG
jgi:hypothetical protein